MTGFAAIISSAETSRLVCSPWWCRGGRGGAFEMHIQILSRSRMVSALLQGNFKGSACWTLKEPRTGLCP